MKLRAEVEEAISEAASDCTDMLLSRNADDLEAAGMRPYLLALVELGVRLGIHDVLGDAYDQNERDRAVARILQAQPGAEEE